MYVFEVNGMSKYLTNWIDYRLPTGQEFSVAICGYSGKVRHMYLGHDPIRRAFAQHVYVEEEQCQTAEHCLALDCPLNRADPEHLLHMLDMTEDEPSDAETAAQWGSTSTLQCFLRFVRKISELLPDEAKTPCSPVTE
jgi:hypothetical protein